MIMDHKCCNLTMLQPRNLPKQWLCVRCQRIWYRDSVTKAWRYRRLSDLRGVANEK